jgi:hypothetical protein
LHLHPKELKPSERKVDMKYPEEPLVIKDMPQMAKFVYEMFTVKLEVVKKEEAEKKEVSIYILLRK